MAGSYCRHLSIPAMSALVTGSILVSAAVAQQPARGQPTAPPEGRAAFVPLGDVAGGLQSGVSGQIDNPFAGQAEAIAQGKQLFTKMNCAGCHNYDGSGGEGPALADRYWRYGGTPVDIFKSIYEGRPQGMPAWGQALPPQDIWKLVTFIQAFGGSFELHANRGVRQGDTKGMLIAPELAVEPLPGASPRLPGSVVSPSYPDTPPGGDHKP
jgi:cytochrome c oxidase cbb3-type subunit III